MHTQYVVGLHRAHLNLLDSNRDIDVTIWQAAMERSKVSIIGGQPRHFESFHLLQTRDGKMVFKCVAPHVQRIA
jgi:hypothetical protein